MSTKINHQALRLNGKPVFAVLPWDEYQELLKNQIPEEDISFPDGVVRANVRGDSLIKAWREYLGLTQAELASRAGMPTSSLARIEKGKSRPRASTLKRLAEAMDNDVTVEHLVD